MRLLIDTTVDSGLGVPGSPESTWGERWLRELGPIPVSSVTVFERVYGFQRATPIEDSGERWRQRQRHYEELVAEAVVYEVLEWNTQAALLGGRLLAAAPFMPPGSQRRHRDKRKSDARRSWLLDVFIAAHAAADGRAVLTHNVSDFQVIAGLIQAPWELQVLSFHSDAESVFGPS